MKPFLLAIYLLSFSWNSFAAQSYSLFLVRHAEKLADSKDPALSICGKKRASQLADILAKADIKAIYSTNYTRTLQTAAPLSTKQAIVISNYQPNKLKELALHLQHKQQNALIVGHSNTTPMLAKLLSKQTVAPLSEQDYHYLYQVQFINKQAVLTIFQQPLDC
ncbi:MAG: SixA phosphatase family protein [Pseudoalteromonas spongiae]